MEQLWSLMPEFWEGFRVTLLLLVVSGVLALVLGTAIAAMRISPVPVLRGFAAAWTEIARNTPLTLVFFFTAFVMPMLGVRAPYVLLAFVALTYYTSPFVAEALRSGINGVHVGQAEAAGPGMNRITRGFFRIDFDISEERRGITRATPDFGKVGERFSALDIFEIGLRRGEARCFDRRRVQIAFIGIDDALFVGS